MPKKVLAISNFEGGMNSAFHSKDIDPRRGEHVFIRNFLTDIKGKLRIIGNGENVDATIFPFPIVKSDLTYDSISTNFKCYPGDRLFVFHTDVQLDGADGLESWCAWLSRDTGNVYVCAKSDTNQTWMALGSTANEISGITGLTYGTLTGAVSSNNSDNLHPNNAAYYFDNGALRISNTNFLTPSFVGNGSTTHGSTSLWFGYIKRDILGGGTDGVAADGWHLYPASLSRPNNTIIPELTSHNSSITLNQGQMGLTAQVGDKDTGALKLKGRKFYLSYHYDGMQESLMGPSVYIVPDTDVPDDSWEPISEIWAQATTYNEGDVVLYGTGEGSNYEEYTATGTSTGDTPPGTHWEKTNPFPTDINGVTQAAYVDTTSDGTRSFILNLHVCKTAGGEIAPTTVGGNRITGVSVYTQRFQSQASGTIEEPDYAFVCKFDFTGDTGYIGQTGAAYTWNADGNNMKVSTDRFSNSFPETYLLRTGIFDDVKSLSARWKKSVVMNRILYAADVFVLDPEAETERHFPDRIIKSLPNQFDVFPTGNHIDVVVNDGENVIKLEAYGNRILQFKNKTLYVINATGGNEYLETTHAHRGIDNEASSVTTPFGVFWANKHGAWLFDGKTVKSILREKINSNEWKDFYPSDSDIASGDCVIANYFPTENHILMYVNDSTEGYHLDVESMAFTKWKGSTIMGDVDNRSKVFDIDGASHWMQEDDAGTLSFKKWRDTPDRSHTTANTSLGDYEFTSAETDLGNTAEKKRIYSVYVTYKTGNQSPGFEVQLYHDGSNYTNNWFLQATNGSWVTEEFSIPQSDLDTVECTNCYIQVVNSSQICIPSLEISDFTIVYRPKKTFGRVT